MKMGKKRPPLGELLTRHKTYNGDLTAYTYVRDGRLLLSLKLQANNSTNYLLFFRTTKKGIHFICGWRQ
jgi:hypothetical protein